MNTAIKATDIKGNKVEGEGNRYLERRKTIALQQAQIPKVGGAMGNAHAFINLLKGSGPKVQTKDMTEQILRDNGLLPKEEIDEMENVQLTNDYYNKIKYMEFTAFFFSWIGLGVAIVEYELRYNLVLDNLLNYQREIQLQIILAINTFCSICTVVSIISRYILILNWQIQKKQLLPLDTLITTKYYQGMVLEVSVVLLAPYPGLQNTFIIEVYPDRGVEVPLNINVLMLCIALMARLYFVIRFALAISKYRNARQQRLCMINGTDASFMFAMKALKKDQPYMFISIALVVPLVVCGYGMRMFERPLIPTSGQNFDSLANCIWCCIITMATVGYGDYFPISNFGRIVGILACLWGVFIVSIFVVTLNNLLEFNKGEEKSYEILCKLKSKEEIRMQAINVILSAQKQRVERQKDDLDPQQLAVVFRDFRKNVFSLKQVSKRVRAMYEDYNDVEMITKDIEEINQEMDMLRQGQTELLVEFQEAKDIIDKRLHGSQENSMVSSLNEFGLEKNPKNRESNLNSDIE